MKPNSLITSENYRRVMDDLHDRMRCETADVVSLVCAFAELERNPNLNVAAIFKGVVEYRRFSLAAALQFVAWCDLHLNYDDIVVCWSYVLRDRFVEVFTDVNDAFIDEESFAALIAEDDEMRAAIGRKLFELAGGPSAPLKPTPPPFHNKQERIMVRFTTQRAYHKTQPQIIAMTPIDRGVYFVDPVRHMEGFLPGVRLNRYQVLTAYDAGLYEYAPPSLMSEPTKMRELRERLTEYALSPQRSPHPSGSVRCKAMGGGIRFKLQFIAGDTVKSEAVALATAPGWIIDTIESYDQGKGYAQAILEYILQFTGIPATPSGVTDSAYMFWVKMAALGLSEQPALPAE